MLNFVVCDDNSSILSKLCKMLEAIFINNDIDATIGLKASKPSDVINYIEQNKVDVLILDINLKSNLNGCDIANIVRKKNKDCYIIFTTGHLEFSLVAYQVKTFDYLPKPITAERLEITICRLFEDLAPSSKKFIKLNSSKVLKEDDIQFIKKDGMKLVFYTESGTHEAYNSFTKLEPCLSENFVRCHKSYIANIDKITNIESSNYKILFDNNNECFIGPKYKNNFMEVLKNGNFTNNLDCD